MSRRRMILYICWLPAAGCLYFFENNTGTRIVLVLSLLTALVPALRRALLAKDLPSRKGKDALEAPVPAPSANAEDGPDDVRAYLPGDPLNRIHWKLSAKREELLVRETGREDGLSDQTRKTEDASQDAPRRALRKTLILCAGAAALVSAALLFLLPAARLSLEALFNRLFAASQAVNAYAYAFYAVPEGQSVLPAAALLCVFLSALLLLTLLTGSRAAAFFLAASSALLQAYFGLSLPGWANVLLFLLFALWLSGRPLRKNSLVRMTAAALLVSATVILFLPGTDAMTEEWSERARDRLSLAAQELSGFIPETPEADREVRRVHTRTLLTGSESGLPEKEFRLVTQEEQQISMPRRLDLVRIALLLLLTAAAVVVPFLPFLWLDRRRRRAQRARELFSSGDTSLAVQAIFQQVIRWLEATGNGAGNIPYREWGEWLKTRVSEPYAESFLSCEILFEQAAYSAHPLSGEQREQALRLLAETEKTLWDQAGWKQKCLLRYRECL